jgi:hypothetical protein
MPYDKEVRGNKLVVFNKDTGDVKGRYPNTPEGEQRAQHQLNLLRAIDHGWKPTGATAKK